MTSPFQQIANNMAANPKRLFLIDSLGALLSAFFLGVILVRFENIFGMPRTVLHYLSIAACVFATYSFLCHLRLPENWRPFLQAIAVANLIYSCITIGLVFHFHQRLTTLGHIYFIGELLILFGLISIELKTASSR